MAGEAIPNTKPIDDQAKSTTMGAVKFRGETKMKKFKYIFQYPYFRLFISYFVIFCNFLIYAEDPVSHSYSKCDIPVIGNAFSMVFTKYPPNGFSALKFFMWFIAVIAGILTGKLILHKWLLNKKLHVGMFKRDQGSWMICFLFTILTVLVSSAIYNLILSLNTSMKSYVITGYIGVINHTFMRVAALGTWLGDFLTAWMVTDMMLQEVNGRYAEWLPKLRVWWTTPWYKRVIFFWVFTVTLTIIVIAAICTTFINWDKLNKNVIYTNELGRAFLASFILVMDFSIVMQDWDFPKFQSGLDIKLPGLNTAQIRFEIPERIRKNFVVHISGKWFQYGVLFIVLLLDLNMWKNQIFYDPLSYGQYVGDDGHIFSPRDAFTLSNHKNKTIYSYAWRNTTIDPNTNRTYISADYKTNSRYRGYSMVAKGSAFIPSLLVFVIFALLIHFFGKLDPTTTKKEPEVVKYVASDENVKIVEVTENVETDDVVVLDDTSVNNKQTNNGVNEQPGPDIPGVPHSNNDTKTDVIFISPYASV